MQFTRRIKPILWPFYNVNLTIVQFNFYSAICNSMGKDVKYKYYDIYIPNYYIFFVAQTVSIGFYGADNFASYNYVQLR